MAKVKTAAALILASALLILSSGCSNANEELGFGEVTEITEYAETTELSFGDPPMIGGDAILCQDTLDDLTANLIIRNISQLPDGSENGDNYCGKFIAVELKDNKSGITVENILPENVYILRNENFEVDGQMRIGAECAADSVELLCIEDKGKKEYILKVEYVQGDDRRITAFASCDMSRYEESGGYLKWYKKAFWNNIFECKVSKSFAYKGGNIFADSLTELEYEFDTENLRVTVRGMDSSEIVFGEPEIGKNSILSQSSLGEYSAVVEIHNILGLPQDNVHSGYGNLYTGEQLFIKLCVKDEVIAYGTIRAELYFGGNDFRNTFSLPEKCSGEGATRIFQIEQNGKSHYIVMQYSIYDKESDTIGADFACFDSEVYEKYKDSPDDVMFPLIWYELKLARLDCDIFNGYSIPISDSFEYIGDGVFRDSVYGYELTFDCERLSAEARPLQ